MEEIRTMAKRPRILVLQHHPDEDPGIFKAFLAQDAISWDAVELDAGEPIPDPSGYDALVAMGGPMDVWQEDIHPWLKAEKDLIRAWVGDDNKPFLGVCLGHQLLAEALGGEVGIAHTPEIGILDVDLTAPGRDSVLYQGLGPNGRALQWHSAEVTRAPDGARVLASSPACPVQAIAWGGNAFGLQYHVEITERTVPAWSAIPEYKAALEKSLGPDALARLKADADAEMASFHQTARQLYDNFKRAAGWD